MSQTHPRFAAGRSRRPGPSPASLPIATVLPICLVLALPLALLVGCDERTPQDQAPARPAADVATAAVEELDWDALIPKEWQPDSLMEQYDLDEIGDEDPRAEELMGKLKRLWAEAPVVPELDGRRVRLPGFVVPIDMEAERIAEFLLVPYYGACIHVPPPPANQTVYVRLPPELAFEGEMFDTLWVTGTLQVSPTQSDLADAGYRLEASAIAPYEGDVEPR